MDSETYKHWWKRPDFWLEGERQCSAPYARVARAVFQAIVGPAQDFAMESMTKGQLYTPEKLTSVPPAPGGVNMLPEILDGEYAASEDAASKTAKKRYDLFTRKKGMAMRAFLSELQKR